MSFLQGRVPTLFMMYILFALAAVGEIKGKIDDKEDPSFLDHNIDKHAIFSLPLSQGAYDFDVDGFVRKFVTLINVHVAVKLTELINSYGIVYINFSQTSSTTDGSHS